MGILVTRDNEKDELTERINSDIRTKMNTTSKTEADKDFTESSEYLKETERTGRFSWIWIVLVVLAIIALVLIAII